MTKQITPDQALALSFSPFRYRRIKTDKKGRAEKDADGNTIYEIAETTRFIKPGETQASALKRLRTHSFGRTKQSSVDYRIPEFVKGQTSTADYVAAFESMNNLLRTDSAAHLMHPAPAYEGPEVVIDTYAEDLV